MHECAPRADAQAPFFGQLPPVRARRLAETVRIRWEIPPPALGSMNAENNAEKGEPALKISRALVPLPGNLFSEPNRPGNTHPETRDRTARSFSSQCGKPLSLLITSQPRSSRNLCSRFLSTHFRVDPYRMRSRRSRLTRGPMWFVSGFCCGYCARYLLCRTGRQKGPVTRSPKQRHHE